MAGLPANVSQLISDKSVSFLRRARQQHLGRIGDADIEVALRKTVATGGASIDEGASSLADIAARMGVRSNYASKYKERLLESGVLGDAGQGFYTVDLPGFKEYVRERAQQ